jgi:hypothetical protein
MNIAQMPPWVRDPVQHAQTLQKSEKLRLKNLDISLRQWDTEAANEANKFDGGRFMKFADIPTEVTQVAAIRTKGPVRLTSLLDGSVLKIVSLRSETFKRARGEKAGTDGTRFLAKSKGGDEFVISPVFHKQLEAGLRYAGEHGKTDEEKSEIEVTLGSVTTGKGDKALTRRVLK